MRTVKAALLFSTFLLAGCMANGPVYNESRIPKGESSTLIVYRPDGFVGKFGTFDVEINGESACDLNNAAFMVAPVKGAVEVTSSQWAAPGTSRIKLDAKPGETHYVRMEYNDSKAAAVIGGGYIGAFIAEGMSSTGGPFVFTHVPPEQAQKELHGLKQSCG